MTAGWLEKEGQRSICIGNDFDGGVGLADCADVSHLGDVTLELVKRG